MSKCNLLSWMEWPKFRLNYFTDCSNLEHLLMSEQRMEEAWVGGEGKLGGFWTKYQNLNKQIADLLETYSKVSFIPLDIEEKWSMAYIIGLCDKANGFCFSLTYLSN